MAQGSPIARLSRAAMNPSYAYRYAEHSQVSIDLEYSGDAFRLSVSDDGIGFPDD